MTSKGSIPACDISLDTRIYLGRGDFRKPIKINKIDLTTFFIVRCHGGYEIKVSEDTHFRKESHYRPLVWLHHDARLGVYDGVHSSLYRKLLNIEVVDTKTTFIQLKFNFTRGINVIVNNFYIQLSPHPIYTKEKSLVRKYTTKDLKKILKETAS
jgi:hypothetical protein